MAEQLTGVLREVLAAADGTPRPVFSTVFTPEVMRPGGSRPPLLLGGRRPPDPPGGQVRPSAPASRRAEIVAGLPLPLVDRADPAAGYLATFAGIAPDQRIAALTQAVAGDPAVPQQVTESAETRLALVRAWIDAGDYDAAAGLLADLADRGPVRLADRLVSRAARPGPGWRRARRVQRACSTNCPANWRPSSHWLSPPRRPATWPPPDTTSAWSGPWTSRVPAPRSAWPGCAWRPGTGPVPSPPSRRVPGTSSHHAAAQIAAVRILVSGGGQGRVSADDLRQADGRLGQLVVDDVRRQQLTVEVLRAALDWCTTGQPAANGPILGCEPNARALRFGLERSYRALARLTPDEDRRIELVDMANAIRPRTLT